MNEETAYGGLKLVHGVSSHRARALSLSSQAGEHAIDVSEPNLGSQRLGALFRELPFGPAVPVICRILAELIHNPFASFLCLAFTHFPCTLW